jgi:hypothetical protein
MSRKNSATHLQSHLSMMSVPLGEIGEFLEMFPLACLKEWQQNGTLVETHVVVVPPLFGATQFPWVPFPSIDLALWMAQVVATRRTCLTFKDCVYWRSFKQASI